MLDLQNQSDEEDIEKDPEDAVEGHQGNASDDPSVEMQAEKIESI